MATSSIPPKRCSTCKEFFPATREYFSPHKETRDKLESRCKGCNRERTRLKRLNDPAYRERQQLRDEQRYANPEYRECKKQQDHERQHTPEFRTRRNELRRERYASDPEYRDQTKRRNNDRRLDPVLDERNRQNVRDWRKTDHGKSLMRAAKRRRRAKSIGAEGTHTEADIDLQYRSQNGKCWHCGQALNGVFEVDHLIPLDRGGSNWPNNLVCSCQKCNRSKSNKLTQEWNGRLF